MADDARRKRAEALEEKKRRLEELKARRAARPSSAKAASGKPKPSRGGNNSAGGNLEEYIDGLLKSDPPAVAPPPAAPTEPSVVKSEAAPEPSISSAPIAAADVAPSPAAPAVPPEKKVETFTFGTQTEVDDFPPAPPDEDDEDQKKDDDQAEEDQQKAKEEKEREPEPAKVLTAQEMEEAVSSPPFSNFLNAASKKVERLLGAPILADLLVDADYTAEADEDGDVPRDRTSDGFVTARHTFEHGRWTVNRNVTDLEWSPAHRELLLSCYHMPQSGSGGGLGSAAVRAVNPGDTPSASLAPRSGELQSDGLALVWSLAMPNRPEHIFTCGSPVLSGRFHPTEAHLVVGGCGSGQLVVWDVRAGRLPVQRSSLAIGGGGGKAGGGLGGHAHPICAMEIVEGGSGLVTAGTDGKLNFWSLANLRDPAESLLVGGNVSSLAVAPEGNAIVVGDESGALHTVLATSGASATVSNSGTGGSGGRPSSSRRAVRKLDVGDNDGAGGGHFGMVTAVSTKVPSPKAASGGGSRAMSRGFLRGSAGMVLTSGVDWTTKLWAPAYTDKPILSFLSHSYDYMCDVQWSPIHPSVFATASSNGSLGLWNLASSLDEPISGSDGIVVEASSALTSGLNKIRWSSDGRRIVAASADKLHVLGMSEDVSRPKGDEDARMMSNLTSRGFLAEE